MPGRLRDHWKRLWRQPLDDDLLAGFEHAGRPKLFQIFFATTIGASLVVWDVAYALGAYHTVFYSRLFQIFVVSTVLLLGSIVLRSQVHVRPWMRVLLAVPALWLVTHSIVPYVLGRTTRAGRVVDDAAVGLVVVSIPFILWAVIRVLAPGYFELPTRRLKIVSVSIVALVALSGFLAGQFNYVFTTCHSYIVAGDDTPSDCRQAPSPSPSPTSSP